MRTANPVLNERTFTRMGAMAGSDVMTIQGTVTKTAIMLFLVVISASYTWNMVGMERSPAGWMMGGAFGAHHGNRDHVQTHMGRFHGPSLRHS